MSLLRGMCSSQEHSLKQIVLNNIRHEPVSGLTCGGDIAGKDLA